MNFDFHTHGKLSKKVEFSLEYFVNMVKVAKENGLDGFALTEHFNTRNFMDVYDTLDQTFVYENEYYLIDGIKVFPAMEVDIREVGHILLIGNRTDIRELRIVLEPFTEKNSFIEFEQLLEKAEAYNLLKIGAHPFRDSTPLNELDPQLLCRLDAFDLNGKDLYQQGIDENSEKVYGFAENLKKPVVGGSDTHHFMQYGCIVSELGQECSTIDELKKVIFEGRYSIEVSSELYDKVKTAKEMKEIEKRKMEKLIIN
ncbi:histidinol-phosphatase [Viridibacillus arvi]|uniref:histidinol-phosphatase n=1 Tax=Viridibacillus arvi TaxID=263475 RepID=UPI0037F9FF21